MDHLTALIHNGQMVGKEFKESGKTFKLAKIDNFSYKDSVDNSLSENQVKG